MEFHENNTDRGGLTPCPPGPSFSSAFLLFHLVALSLEILSDGLVDLKKVFPEYFREAEVDDFDGAVLVFCHIQEILRLEIPKNE